MLGGFRAGLGWVAGFCKRVKGGLVLLPSVEVL